MEIFEITLRYTEEELKKLVEGPRIKRADWLKSLPPDLKDHLMRLSEVQRAGASQFSPSFKTA